MMRTRMRIMYLYGTERAEGGGWRIRCSRSWMCGYVDEPWTNNWMTGCGSARTAVGSDDEDEDDGREGVTRSSLKELLALLARYVFCVL